MTSWQAALLLLTAGAVWADGGVGQGLVDRAAATAAAAGVTAAEYPNADDVLVEESIRVKYRTDGTSVTWDDEVVKVLTEKGKREGRSRSFHFTLPYSTVTVERAELIKPDGRIVGVDVAAQSRIMVDRSQMRANIYNPNRKILKLTLPGLYVGDVYRILSRRDTVKARVPGTWSDYTVFEYTAPLKHITYEVIGPASLPLRSIAMKDELPGTVSSSRERSGDMQSYRWEVRDVPRMFREPNMPPLHTVVQRLLVSTIPDWEYISRWYWNLCLPHLDATTPGMSAMVDSLASGAGSRQERIEAVFRFVSQKIRYMGITTETEAPGYEPHDVGITFENRYGVCRDKAALLVSMLRMAGLPAYPVLIHTGPKKDAEVPQPFFNHAIVAVADASGGYRLMDPTDETTTELLPAYLCNKSYLVAHPEGEGLRVSPIVPAARNMMHVSSRGRLRDDGSLRVRSLLRFEGINDNAYRGYLARLKPEERRRFFEGLVKRRVAGAGVSELAILPETLTDTSQPLTVELEYGSDAYLVEGNTHAMCPPPWLGTSVGYVNFVLGKTGLEQRKYPLVTDVACGVRETFALELHGNVGAPVAMPGAVELRTNRVSFSQSLRMETNTLVGASSFLLNTVEFSPRAYVGLKRLLEEVEYARRQRPVFEAPAVNDKSQDVLVLQDETTATFRSATDCDITHAVRKKVLSYAGKKRHAELKFSYNPAWEEISLEHAGVRNTDGSERSVAPEEINMMDAPWVGDAPRYPAAKTMVVSLPGVEVGSVIEYRTVRRLRGLPFVSFRTPFRQHEPVQRARLTVRTPDTGAIRVADRTDETVKCVRYREGEQTVLEWTAERLAPLPREDALPPLWSLSPTVMVSAGKWPAYAAAAGAALKKAARRQTEAAAAAQRLASQHEGRRTLVRAIRDFVAMRIQSAGPGLDDLPLACVTPADRTLREGYGNTADRAVLLYAMLDAEDLAPEFVLAPAHGLRVAELRKPLLDCPQRDVFSDVLVRVRVDEETVYLNDTDQYARLGATRHDGQPGMLVDGSTVTLHASTAMKDRVETDYAVHLAPDGDAVMVVTNRYYGMDFAAFHRTFAELPPEERRRNYRETLGRLSQAAEPETELITRYDVYPGIKTFTARVPRYAVRAGFFLYLTLPELDTPPLRLRSDRRESPLYRPQTKRVVKRCRVRLPEGRHDLCLAPEDLTWEGPAGLGRVSLQRRVEEQGGRLTVEVTRDLDLDSALIPAGYYPALLEFNRRVTHPASRTLLFGLDIQD